jgi:hypothetical protein
MQWAQYNAAIMARRPHFPWLEVLHIVQHHFRAHRDTHMAGTDIR